MLMSLFVTRSLFAQEAAQPDEKPILTFACLSDLHSQQTLISGSVEAVRLRGTIQKTLDAIKKAENIDLIVLGGDYLSDVTISYENYLRTRELLVEATRNTFSEDSKTPVIYVNGNHEYEVANFDAVPKGFNAGDYYDIPMKTDIGALADEDCFYEMASNGSSDPVKLLAAYHYVINGFDFVVLNTGKNFFQNAWNYTYSDESIEWVGGKLEEIYAENPNKTVFFLVHLPFSDSNSISSASKGMTDGCAELLKPILAQYPNLIMLYGHDHGKDSAYIRENTAQRVTQYDSNGNIWTAPVEEEEEEQPVSTSVAVKNAADGKYLTYDPSTNLTTSESLAVATVDASASVEGTFYIAYPGGSDTRYVSSGSSGRFSGNADQGENTSIYFYKVEDSSAKSGTAKKVTEIKNNGAYLLVTKSSKGGYYMLTNEPYGSGTSLRLVGTKVSDEVPGDEISFEQAENYSPVWVIEDQATDEEEATALYNIQNYNTGKYLGFNSVNLANTDEATSDVTVTALANGSFNIYLSNYIASLNNPYLYCGSSGRFSGNKDPQNASSQVMAFEVEDPTAATITAVKAAKIVAGKTYLLVGTKSSKYYALTNEMYKEGDADNQRMVGLEVTIADDKITYTPSAGSSALWTFVAKPEGSEPEVIAPALCNIQNYKTGKYLGFNSYNLANTNKATSDVTITASSVTKGAFLIHLTRAVTSNPYLYCGSSGRFSGNKDAANASSQILAFEVEDPTAATITAAKAAKVVAGKTYLLVGIKDGKYYALTNEMYENETSSQRMVGLKVTIADDKITYTPSGDYSALWTINEQVVVPEGPGTPSFFSAFMGSMRYYSNSIDGGSSINDSRIIQALMVYVYADRVELKMKNYGESGTINGITINEDLIPYVSYRTVEHSAEAVTAAPAFAASVVGGEVVLGQPISLELNVPEWHNVYYTVDGSVPTEASAKVVNGIIQWTPEATGEYVVKIAAQEGVRLLSQSVESPKFVVKNDESSIESIEVVKEATIYTVTGKTVGGSVKHLDKGLYIVNGKKMIIK